jgi:hypothetical protein
MVLFLMTYPLLDLLSETLIKSSYITGESIILRVLLTKFSDFTAQGAKQAVFLIVYVLC